MSAASLPAASAVVAPSDAPIAPLTVDEILEQLKGRSATDLFKVLKNVLTLYEKASKVASKKGTKKATAIKKNSNVPLTAEEAEKAAATLKRGAQLDKPRAWVTYVAEHARANGWPAFPAKVTTKDKVTGEKTESIVEMPASEEQDGEYVFPDGKKFNHKHAMSLSKTYWVAKTKTGSRQDLYQAFEIQYVPPVPKTTAQITHDTPVPHEQNEEEAKESESEPVFFPSAAASPAPKSKKVAPKKSPTTKKDDWIAPKDGKFAPWTFNGRTVRRNKDNYVIGTDMDGEDEWLGLYNPQTNLIQECDVPEEFFDN